jgi:hypothetical protein
MIYLLPIFINKEESHEYTDYTSPKYLLMNSFRNSLKKFGALAYIRFQVILISDCHAAHSNKPKEYIYYYITQPENSLVYLEDALDRTLDGNYI